MSKMNPVVHFEMPYDDRERMAKFYQEAFGWQTQMLGEDMGNYVLATTTETDGSRPKEPGAINGGFFPKRPDWPAQHPSVVIAVDDIQAAMKTVTEAGGTRRAAGDTGRRPVRRVLRYGRQPREHASTPSAQLVGPKPAWEE
ncbi:MAG TPA: VOC family protein, partial [Vicinamibacterales bacterium]|nr:VOC family protein [Vicinamibacterales bacterium]